MKPNMKRALLSLAVLSAAGCGGTDPAKEVGNRMNISIASTSEAVAGNAVTINATVTSSPAAIANMSWTLQKTGNSPDVTLVNSDCKTKSVSNGGTTLDPVSTWSCAVDVITPVTLSSNADYRLVVNASDAKGNSSNGQNVLTVKPSPAAAPTAQIVGQNSTKSGDFVSLNCQGSGGTTAVKDKYTYQWVITDRSNVDSFLISSPKDAFVGQFIAPAVTQPQKITIGCRVTDDALRTGIAYQDITINPTPAPRIIPSVVDGLTFAPGASYKFDTSKTAWIDSQGNTVPSKGIFYSWSQKSGPAVTLLNPSSATPTVIFPTNVASGPEGKDTYVFTMAVSEAPFPVNLAVNTYQTVDVVMYVNTVPPISVSGGASATFKSGTLGQASITATGQAGYPIYYSWTQISGPAVTIAGTNRNAISFVAPAVTGTNAVPLVFRVGVSYAPITSSNTNVVFTDVLVAVTQ